MSQAATSQLEVVIEKLSTISLDKWKKDSKGGGVHWYEIPTEFGRISLLKDEQGTLYVSFYDSQHNQLDSIPFAYNQNEYFGNLYNSLEKREAEKISRRIQEDRNKFKAWLQR